ncbi:hypothetical protein SAMN02745704_00622 [Paucidesulfovibrio gracilis DSM 16080]|uniref:Uncharacterized protein n=1 Tax=Paucidesulfovibrio gracilis DSM 16080 TaxID=1121449 RepID=A0A1T4WC10_9BACT|nr:hypothetical protein SAMN02745704_00622 [Paucidesulfovibrio gracilis DSM 16080]
MRSLSVETLCPIPHGMTPFSSFARFDTKTFRPAYIRAIMEYSLADAKFSH